MACKVKNQVQKPPPVSSGPTSRASVATARSQTRDIKKAPTNLSEARRFTTYHSETLSTSLKARRARMCLATSQVAKTHPDPIAWLRIKEVAPHLTEEKAGKPDPNEPSQSMALSHTQLDYIHLELQEWFEEAQQKKTLNPIEADTAFFYLDQYLFSVTHNAGNHTKTIEDIFSFFPKLLSPAFANHLTKDWHFRLQLVGGFLDAIETLVDTASQKKRFAGDLKKPVENLLQLLNTAPYEQLSMEAKACFHAYKARIGSYLGWPESERFHEIKCAAETGQADAQLDMGLVFCGLFFDSEAFTDLEKGLDYLTQLAELEEETLEDDFATLREEQMLLLLYQHRVIPSKKETNIIGRQVVKLALSRHFGIGCIKRLDKEMLFLGFLETFHSRYHLLYTSLLAVLEKRPDKLRRLPGEDDSATRNWFSGKRLELKNQPESALAIYERVAKTFPLAMGVAPIRLACSTGRWKQALESLLHYHQALVDNNRQDEAEDLEEEILQLSTMLDTEPAPALTQDTGKTKKRRKKSGVPSAVQTVIDEPKTELPTAQPEEVEIPPTHTTSKLISTPHATEETRRAFNRALNRINHLIRTKKYSTALHELSQMVPAPTRLHHVKARQVEAWAKRCQAMDHLEIRRIAGQQKSQQSSVRTELRHEAEQVTLNALAKLIECNGGEREQMVSDPSLITKTRTYSREVRWTAGSLCSTVGHIYSDTAREHSQMKYLGKLATQFYTCANTVNPCRQLIKCGQPLPPQDKAAARY